MKGFYRAMMLLLVFCLCGAVIVGCGGDGTTETTGEETTAAGTEDGSDVTTAPGTETERNTEGKTTTDTEEVTTGLSDAEIKKQKMDAIRANTKRRQFCRSAVGLHPLQHCATIIRQRAITPSNFKSSPTPESDL